MCFSPEVSFITSVGLGAAGVATAAVAPKQKKMFALIPLAFSFQQALEGIQWLWLRSGAVCESAAYGFLFFALIIWPAAIPIGVYMVDKERRSIVRWFVAAGVLLSVYFAYVVVLNGVSVAEINKSIHYTIISPISFPGSVLFYLVVTMVPLFISSLVALRWFGVVMLFSSALAYYFFTITFMSVWCFFAAVLSALIFVYVYKEKGVQVQAGDVVRAQSASPAS